MIRLPYNKSFCAGAHFDHAIGVGKASLSETAQSKACTEAKADNYATVVAHIDNPMVVFI